MLMYDFLFFVPFKFPDIWYLLYVAYAIVVYYVWLVDLKIS